MRNAVMAVQITIRGVPEEVRDELASRAALELPLATLDRRLQRTSSITVRFLVPG